MCVLIDAVTLRLEVIYYELKKRVESLQLLDLRHDRTIVL